MFWIKFIGLTLCYTAAGAALGYGIAWFRPHELGRRLFADPEDARRAAEEERADRGRQERIRAIPVEIAEATARLNALQNQQPAPQQRGQAHQEIGRLQGQLARLNAELAGLQGQQPAITTAQVLAAANQTAQNASTAQWWFRIAWNNDWLFAIPLLALVVTFAIATTHPGGPALLLETEEAVKAQMPEVTYTDGRGQTASRDLLTFLNYGAAQPPASASRTPAPPPDRKSWFWWLSTLLYLGFIPLGAVLAFHDEVSGAIRRLAQRRQAPAPPPQQGGGQHQPAPRTMSHGAFLIWEGLFDFVSAFAAEYMANRAANRRLI